MEGEKKEPILKITPRFDFIYELGMPTGKKIKSSIILMLIFIFGFIIFCVFKDKADISNINGINFNTIMYFAFIIAIIFSIIKLIVHIVMKKLQYENITYTFYDEYMTYEDAFLNQHKKNIKYENVKEVEIRRTIWDRLLGFGIIVIYTNAENEYSNGLVIYGIKEPKDYYEKIEKLVHLAKSKSSNNIEVKKDEYEPKNVDINVDNKVENLSEETQTHEEFLESLKNINKDE